MQQFYFFIGSSSGRKKLFQNHPVPGAAEAMIKKKMYRV
jgi:hypothetical protein